MAEILFLARSPLLAGAVAHPLTRALLWGLAVAQVVEVEHLQVAVLGHRDKAQQVELAETTPAAAVAAQHKQVEHLLPILVAPAEMELRRALLAHLLPVREAVEAAQTIQEELAERAVAEMEKETMAQEMLELLIQEAVVVAVEEMLVALEAQAAPAS